MSLFKKLVSKAVSVGTHGLVNLKAGSAGRQIQQQQADSVKSSVKVSPFGYQRQTTSYYTPSGSKGGGGNGSMTKAITKPGASCAPMFDGTRFKAQRLNKSTYVTRGGGTSRWPQQLQVHPAGTECVTVRRRHVTNAKALRRAISRVKGFVKTYRKAAALVGARHHRSSTCRSCGKNPCRCK